MTDEASLITGDLTVRTYTRPGSHHAHVTIQYTGAEERYTLTGSPTPIPEGGLAASTTTSSPASDMAKAPRPPDSRTTDSGQAPRSSSRILRTPGSPARRRTCAARCGPRLASCAGPEPLRVVRHGRRRSARVRRCDIAHCAPGLREALGDAALFLDGQEVPSWVTVIEELHADGDRRAEAVAALARSAFLADQADAELKAWSEAVQALRAVP